MLTNATFEVHIYMLINATFEVHIYSYKCYLFPVGRYGLGEGVAPNWG